MKDANFRTLIYIDLAIFNGVGELLTEQSLV